MVTPWTSAFRKRRLRPTPPGMASLAVDRDCHDRYMSPWPHPAISRLGPEVSNLVVFDFNSPPHSDGASMRVS
jgi:hypothetical protein